MQTLSPTHTLSLSVSLLKLRSLALHHPSGNPAHVPNGGLRAMGTWTAGGELWVVWAVNLSREFESGFCCVGGL